MKPKKRFFCLDAQRAKLLFETRKKASTFMKFNNKKISGESGFHPTRSYYCETCCGWHVTSKKETGKYSRSKKIIAAYRRLTSGDSTAEMNFV